MTNLTDVTIGERRFRVERLPARTQLHVLRRLGPALVAVIPTVIKLTQADEAMSDEETVKLVGTLMDAIPDTTMAIAAMSDRDVDYVIDACLDASYIMQGDTPARVRMNGALMFHDINLPTMIQLSYKVIEVSCADFFPTGLLKDSKAAPVQA